MSKRFGIPDTFYKSAQANAIVLGAYLLYQLVEMKFLSQTAKGDGRGDVKRGFKILTLAEAVQSKRSGKYIRQ